MQILQPFRLPQASITAQLFTWDAKRYYLDKIDSYAISFQQVTKMLEEEYNSDVRQARVKTYLNSLRVTTFIANCMESFVALAQIYNSTIKLSGQVSRQHQGDSHKVEFLRNVVFSMSWSKEPLSTVVTHNLTFQEVYSELEAALQLEKESKIVIFRERAQLRQNVIQRDDNADILCIIWPLPVKVTDSTLFRITQAKRLRNT